jgi:hypothetical protein
VKAGLVDRMISRDMGTDFIYIFPVYGLCLNSQELRLFLTYFVTFLSTMG